MLAQHLITRPVFDALFEGYSFAEHNPVSKVMQAMLDELDQYDLHAENETLDRFYESVRLRAEGIDNAAGKQAIITELYEKFFRLAFPKAAASLGIVYTPVQIVDFIIRSVDHLLATELGASLSDEGVHILDPFTGTGSFVVRLMESGLIRPGDLARKYASEIHANEILLLAYYIAAINIEATYHGLLAEHDSNVGYTPFDGIVLADTFQMTETDDVLDTSVFPTNNERATRQLDLDIRVIVGNPPYSVGQTSANDNNANLKYPTLDGAIERTYAAGSSATLKNSLYDSYIRAIRWATDRIKDAGVIGFVTNGGFLDANTADGLRKTLSDEFASIYVFNLRGNQRTAGETSRKEGGKVFGAGSRNTVAITFLVKKPGHAGPAAIHYRDIGDYLSRESKLDIIAASDLALMDWQSIAPNDAGDWLNQRGDTFAGFTPIADQGNAAALFRTHSGGLKTNRDAWVYNFSASDLKSTVDRAMDFFNEQVRGFTEWAAEHGAGSTVGNVESFINHDPQSFSWDRADKPRVARGVYYAAQPSAFRTAAYRPFQKEWVYFDRQFNNTVYQLPRIFPTSEVANVGFYVVGAGSDKAFSVLATEMLPDLAFWGSSSGQYLPRWTFEPIQDGETGQGALSLVEQPGEVIDGFRRVDNISSAALAGHRATYGPEVTGDDVFFYVYGLLHSPDYRSAFAADLKKLLPRIPKVPGEHFRTFVDAGRALAELHVGYETVEPYPLTITGEPPATLTVDELYDWYRVEKMRHPKSGRTADTSTVLYNSRITVSGIPADAHEYVLGSRSAVAWVMDRYQVKTDKASGIVNDPNDWSREVGDPRYILDLLARVVRVSVETVRIVEELPSINFKGLS
jgi:predicted helicase